MGLPFGACRFVTPPKALVAAGKADYLTMTIDRQGVAVRVTAVERTVVDVLHRSDIAGGTEEVLKSLDLVRYLDPAKVGDYVELLDNRSIASVSGWWLEERRSALGVTDDVLARLRARLPRSKRYRHQRTRRESTGMLSSASTASLPAVPASLCCRLRRVPNSAPFSRRMSRPIRIC